MNIKLTPAQLSALLKNAFQLRQLLPTQPNAYRLINGAADQLSYVTIDAFNGVFILRTADQTADALVPALTKILESQFGAKAVLLKNHNEMRRKLKLSLTDKILTGGLTENRLSFEEGGARYDFDTSDCEVFPLEDRPMRAFLRHFAGPKSACLAVSARDEGLLPCGHQVNVWQHIPVVGLDFSTLTAKIREALPSQEVFDVGVLDLSSCKISPEHRKAVFHLLYGFLKRIRENGYVQIKTQNWPETNRILGLIRMKSRKSITLLTLENSGADFAVQAGRVAPLYATLAI